MSDSCVPLVIAPTSLSYQTDWACVETTTPGVLFRKDEALASHGIYGNVTFTATSAMISKHHSKAFGSGVVPFFIIDDGSPIDIKITKGRDRRSLGDHRGTASVNFDNNSYENDVTSNAVDERRFGNCPLPLTSFIPRNPMAQPIQLNVNLVNNVYPSSSNNGPPFAPKSAITVKLTMLNSLSGDEDDPAACDMVLAEGSPCLTQEKTVSGPTRVQSGGKTAGNAGVYQSASSDGPMGIRGAVGYVIPGGNGILVIYFDAVKCRLLAVDTGTVINSKVVDEAEAEGDSFASGSLVLDVLDGEGANFMATARAEVMPGSVVEMNVSLRNVFTVPGFPGEGGSQLRSSQ